MKHRAYKRWPVNLGALLTAGLLAVAGILVFSNNKGSKLGDSTYAQNGNGIGVNNSAQQMCIAIQGANNPDCPQQASKAQPDSASTTAQAAGSLSSAPVSSSSGHHLPPLTDYLGPTLNSPMPTPTSTYTNPYTTPPPYKCVSVSIPDSSYSKSYCGYTSDWVGHSCTPIFAGDTVLWWPCY